MSDLPKTWPCACGKCDVMLTEKVFYRPNGWVSRRSRPRYANQHQPRGKMPDEYYVPRAPVAATIRKHMERTGMDQKQMARLLGYSDHKTGGTEVSHVLTSRCPRMRRDVAERILRRLAGLPTLPTAYERQLSDRRGIGPTVRKAS